jgi:hypothetical protein
MPQKKENLAEASVPEVSAWVTGSAVEIVFVPVVPLV